MPDTVQEVEDRQCPRCHGLGELPNHDLSPRCGGSGELPGCWAIRFGQTHEHDRKACGHYA
jgi:RecJ-like exonuclease